MKYSMISIMIFVILGCVTLKESSDKQAKYRGQDVEIHFSKNIVVGEPYDFSVSVKSDSADSFNTPVMNFSSIGLPHVYILNNEKLNYLYNINNTYVYGRQVTLYSRGTYRLKIHVDWLDGSFCNKAVQFRVF